MILKAHKWTRPLLKVSIIKSSGKTEGLAPDLIITPRIQALKHHTVPHTFYSYYVSTENKIKLNGGRGEANVLTCRTVLMFKACRMKDI